MTALQLYEKNYGSIGFERLGLFEIIAKRFNPATVLYVGSSIHVTPSFLFQNVTYVDNSPLCEDFFQERDSVLELISSRKQYKQNPWFDFVKADYNYAGFTLPVKYDLVLSLFAPESLDLSIRSIMPKGALLYLPLPSDNQIEIYSDNLQLIDRISYISKKYHFQQNLKTESIKKKYKGDYMKGDLFKETNTYDLYHVVSDGNV